MATFTDYLWFTTARRQEFVRITDQVRSIVEKSGVRDGMVLVSAMHITAAVYVNDWEDGLIHDFEVWLEKLAPAGLPYRHHQTGEDNADAHLKRTLMGHQVIVPVTSGDLDLGPWEQVFYAEFDGQRKQARGREGDGRALEQSAAAAGPTGSYRPAAFPAGALAMLRFQVLTTRVPVVQRSGRGPFKAKTRVRIPSGTPTPTH